MNSAQSVAAMRAPARAARIPAEESAAEESLYAHASRLLRSRLGAVARRVLDAGIALLQRLRQRTGGAHALDAEDDENRSRLRHAEPGRRRDAAAPADEEEAEAPKPKHRVGAFLIYFSVWLAGGMVGGALAYELLAKLLDRQATHSRRLEAALSKHTKSAVSKQKNLDEAQTKRAEAEKKLEEAKKKQIEAEKKLEAALNDSKAAAEKQKKLDEAVKLLESIRAADRSNTAQRAPPVSSSGEGRARPPKSGDCTLAARNINALKDCVEDFNR